MTPVEAQLLGEIEALHKKLDRLQLSHRRQFAARSWLGPVLHDLEYNPKTQYRVHITASYFWIISAIPILIFFFGFPDQWLQYGVLVTLIYSLYANFATDYGAASAALAAMHEAPLPVIPMDVAK